MKHVLACLSVSACLLMTSCTQSSEKLLDAANKYHEKKQYQEASILYQKAIAKDKLNAEAYYRQGLNLIDDKKIAEAVSYLRRAVDLKPGNVDASTKLAEIYLTAYQADPKRYQSLMGDVKELDSKILAKDPNSFDGLRIKALIALSRRQARRLTAYFCASEPNQTAFARVGWLVRAGLPSSAAVR